MLERDSRQCFFAVTLEGVSSRHVAMGVSVGRVAVIVVVLMFMLVVT